MSLIGPYKEPGIANYTGLPGHGKSFQAAQLIVEWMRAGLPVLSNLKITALPFSIIPVKWGEFVLLDDDDFLGVDPVLDSDGQQILEPEKATDDKKTVAGRMVPKMQLRLLRKLAVVCRRYPGRHVLVVIDEAPNYYPSQDYRGNPKALKAFLKQHRHMNVSVVAVAQNHGMLDNHFTRLCQEFRQHENMVKDSKLEVLLWWFGDNFHRAYSHANRGGKPYTKEKFGLKFFRITAKKAAVYSTVQMHATDMPGRMRKVRGRGLRLVGLCFFVLLIGGVISGILNLYGSQPVQAALPSDKAAPIGESVVLVAFEAVGRKQFICHYEDGRKVCEPYSVERAYELADQVGQAVEVGHLPKRSFSSVVKGGIR